MAETLREHVRNTDPQVASRLQKLRKELLAMDVPLTAAAQIIVEQELELKAAHERVEELERLLDEARSGTVPPMECATTSEKDAD